MENRKKKMKLKTRRRIIVAVLALIIFLILFGIIKSIINLFSPEISAGNLSNLGLAISDKKTTYYNKYEKGIIKVEDGKEEVITDQKAYSLTKVGDKIYYLTVSSENTIDLNCIKDNGDDVKKIKTLRTSLDKFYINNDYVYYVSDVEHSSIVELSLETLGEKTLREVNVQDFVVYDNKIYFVDLSGYLYSMKLDGSGIKELAKDYKIKKFQILEDWIYFYDDKENALCKINKNGSSKKTVATFVNNETYNVTSKGIYYLDSINKQICFADLKGKKSKGIVSLVETTTRINISNGMIYYLDISKDEFQIHQMYRIHTNGELANPIEY